MSRYDWAPWGVVAVLLSALVVFGSVVGQVKARLADGQLSPITVGLTVRTPTYAIPVGVRFHAEVIADGAASLGGYAIDLRYPTNLLHLETIDLEPALAAPGRGSVELEPIVDRAAGVVRFSAFNCPADPCGGPTPDLAPIGPSGRLVLATLQFTALAPGESAFQIDAAAVADTGRRLQPVRINPAPLTVTPTSWVLSWYDTLMTRGEDYLLVDGYRQGDGDVEVTIGRRVVLERRLAPDENWVVQYPAMRGGPIVITPRTDRPIQAARRSYLGTPAQVAAWPSDRLASVWYFPWHNPGERQAWALVSNLNAADLEATIRFADTFVGRITVPSQTTEAIELPRWRDTVLSVETRLARTGEPVNTLVTLRVGSLDPPLAIELPGTPATGLFAEHAFAYYDGQSSADPDTLILGNPGPAPVVAGVVLGRQRLASVPLEPGELSEIRFLNRSGGPLLVRSHLTADPARPAAVLAALRGGADQALARIVPSSRLDAVTSAVDFLWPNLSQLTDQEWLIVANPGAEPISFVVQNDGTTLYAAAIAPFAYHVVDLPIDLKGRLTVAAGHAERSAEARPVLATKRSRWQGSVGEIPGAARPVP